MGFHTFPVDRAPKLEDESRYRYLSREELLSTLDPEPDWVAADLGSGTGFYTDDVAPFVDTCYAVDVQPEMHAFYREKGLPGNVTPVTAEVADLPLPGGELDGAISTMTFHEFASDAALAEVARVLAPGGRLVVADWSAAGEDEAGPPLDERFSLAEARELVSDAGLAMDRGEERPETFLFVAVAD